MAERIIDIQGVGGGEADSFYRGPANSFAQGENVEIRKRQEGFTLSPILEDTGWVFDDDITLMENLETLGVNNGGIIVCLENGEIYLDGVLKHTLSSSTNPHNRVIGIGVNEVNDVQYVYYVTQNSFGAGKIHRSTIDLDTWIDNRKDYQVSSTNPDFIGVINNSGILYLGIKNKVFIIDKDEVMEEYFIMPSEETIVGFTQFQGRYKVYTNVGTTGVQYIWDGFSELPDVRTEWINQPIMGVVNDGSKDYAVLGFNENYSDLYLIQGTQKQELRVNLEAANDSRRLNRYISIREGIVYISGGRTGQSQNYGVYTYGNYYPGQQISLVQSLSLGADTFLHHVHGNAFSYFACADDKVYKVSHNENPTYAVNGYIDSLVYEGGVWEELTLDRFKSAFALNGGTINIYARTDIADTFELIKSIDSAYNSKKKAYVSVQEWIRDNSTELGTFQELQFRIELVRGAIVTKSPLAKRFSAWCKTLNNT